MKTFGPRAARCSDYSTEARNLDFFKANFLSFLKCWLETKTYGTVHIVSTGWIYPQSYHFGILLSASPKPAKSSEPVPVKILITVRAISTF